VRDIDWVEAPIVESSLASEDRRLLKFKEAANKLRDQKVSNQKKLVLMEEELAVLTERIKHLNSVDRFAINDIAAIVEQRSKLDKDVSDLVRLRLLGVLPQVDDFEGLEHAFSINLSAAKESASTKLEDTRVQRRLQVQAREELIRQESKLSQLTSELRSIAQALLSHGHDGAHCPLCESPFKPGELAKRVEAISARNSEKAISSVDATLRKLADIEASESRFSMQLDLLQQYAEAVDINSKTNSVGVVLADARTRIAKGREVGALIESLDKRLSAYSSIGLTPQSLVTLCFDEKDSDKNMIVRSADLDATLEKCIFRSDEVNEEIQHLHDEAENIVDAIELLLIDAKLPYSLSIDECLKALSSRIVIIGEASAALNWARTLIELAPPLDMRSSLSLANSAVLTASSVHVSAQAEVAAGTKMQELTLRAANVRERLKELSATKLNISKALVTLEKIREEHSIENASQAVIAATNVVANEIFSRIHMPNEFELVSDAEVPLLRRSNKSSVALNQVSTGQRAAYALSVFLAMNAQIKAGPKVILLDDPISHIDDLNALSFLDYLRNLVVKEDRQIFFATADERIAGLFAHKFSFLDKEFRTIELAR
jgi:DNA repair protein SbcC/Rad50